jgi:hypothetical protein
MFTQPRSRPENGKSLSSRGVAMIRLASALSLLFMPAGASASAQRLGEDLVDYPDGRGNWWGYAEDPRDLTKNGA